MEEQPEIAEQFMEFEEEMESESSEEWFEQLESKYSMEPGCSREPEWSEEPEWPMEPDGSMEFKDVETDELPMREDETNIIMGTPPIQINRVTWKFVDTEPLLSELINRPKDLVQWKCQICSRGFRSSQMIYKFEEGTPRTMCPFCCARNLSFPEFYFHAWYEEKPTVRHKVLIRASDASKFVGASVKDYLIKEGVDANVLKCLADLQTPEALPKPFFVLPLKKVIWWNTQYRYLHSDEPEK